MIIEELTHIFYGACNVMPGYRLLNTCKKGTAFQIVILILFNK